MDILSKIWLSAFSLFEPVQYFFNGNFWKTFIKKFGRFKGKKVLDLACGTGEINKLINPSEYLGIDVNKFYINYARKRFKNKRTSFQLGDIVEINNLGKFDVALLISATHHLSNEQLSFLITSIRKSNTKKLIIVDALPRGFLAQVLKWLDATLGGGKYFRILKEIASLLSKNKCKIAKKGYFEAARSFYIYYYLIIDF